MAKKYQIFTCGHDDPSWCGKECTKVLSELEWLDIMWKHHLVEINTKGKIREKRKKASK